MPYWHGDCYPEFVCGDEYVQAQKWDAQAVAKKTVNASLRQFLLAFLFCMHLGFKFFTEYIFRRKQ